MADLKWKCKWGNHPRHRGRCREWWDAHREAKRQQSRVVVARRTNGKSPQHSEDHEKQSEEWKRQMQEARRGLDEAFLNRQSLDFWIAQMRHLLETRER